VRAFKKNHGSGKQIKVCAKNLMKSPNFTQHAFLSGLILKKHWNGAESWFG